MKVLAVEIEKREFSTRKTEILAQTRANIDRMEAVTNMLTKNGDGTPAVDPAQIPAVPLKRNPPVDENNEHPDQPSLKQLCVDPTTKVKAIAVAHQVRFQVLQEELELRRRLYAEAASNATKNDRDGDHK